MKRSAIVAIAALALTALMPAAASAQIPFSIDGNIPDAGATQTPDPTGGSKELGPVNGTNTKVGVIHSAAPPMLDFTNPNGQVDLVNIWMDTAKDPGTGDQWLYFAWQRDSRTGSGVIAFEFQQAALSPSCAYSVAGIDMVEPQSPAETSLINSCNPFQNRQAGDFLILWDQSGGTIIITKRVFSLNASTGQLVLGPTVPLGSASGVTGGNGFFGEGRINLTDDVFPPSGDCVNFANIIPGTITGNSDQADYKDTVLDEFEPISNCGSVRIKKVTQPAGLSAPTTDAFQYTLARTNNDSLRFNGIKSIVQSLTGHNDSDDHSALIAGGNYTLVEAAQVAPWELVGITCVIKKTGGDVSAGPSTGFSVEAGELTECTITNKLQQGTLIVIKHVINDNGGAAVASDFTMSLGDPSSTSFAGAESPGVSTVFAAGTSYNVTESGPSGYTESKSAGCSGTIVAGTTVTCTITNNDNAPSLTLNKIVINDNGGTLTESAWRLTANGGAAGTLTGLGASGSADVVSDPATFKQGTYALSEALASGQSGNAGYSSSGFTCSKNGGAAAAATSITLGLGDSAVCSITNDDAKASPGGSTVQRVILHDRLNITTGIRRGTGETLPLTATFRLYSDQNCSTQVGADETVNFVFDAPTGTSTSGHATTVNGVLVSASGTYRWRVTFSGNNFNEGFTTACGSEITAVTITE